MAAPILYALHDSDPGIRQAYGARPVNRAEAAWLNDMEGWGIFHTINPVRGRRIVGNVTRIVQWAVDIDEGSKREQWVRLRACPLPPSRVVESRRSLHAYWWSTGEPSVENYGEVVRRLIALLGADRAVSSPVSLLRAPGYYHLKEPKRPWLVEVVEEQPLRYLEETMIAELPETPKRPERTAPRTAPEVRMETALELLSGHDMVRGEYFRLAAPSAAGNQTILVADNPGGPWQSTPCFVGEDGRWGCIGGGGGPWQTWVAWYYPGMSLWEAERLARDELPELWELTRAGKEDR